MSVDAETVRRVAHLARVAVAEDEVEHLRGELNAMLAFVEQLAEVDVKDVEPMTSVTPMAMKKRERCSRRRRYRRRYREKRSRNGRSLFPRSESGGIMCLACEQNGLWLAYLRQRGLITPDGYFGGTAAVAHRPD